MLIFKMIMQNSHLQLVSKRGSVFTILIYIELKRFEDIFLKYSILHNINYRSKIYYLYIILNRLQMDYLLIMIIQCFIYLIFEKIFTFFQIIEFSISLEHTDSQFSFKLKFSYLKK